MPRHKKTKEQKIRADERQQNNPVDYSYTPTFTYTSSVKATPHIFAKTKGSSLSFDLRRTLITSSSLVILEFILFFVLKTYSK